MLHDEDNQQFERNKDSESIDRHRVSLQGNTLEQRSFLHALLSHKGNNPTMIVRVSYENEEKVVEDLASLPTCLPGQAGMEEQVLISTTEEETPGRQQPLEM